jgi:hypothetical protein
LLVVEIPMKMIRILGVLATAALKSLARLVKRLTSPGSGPFFAGC